MILHHLKFYIPLLILSFLTNSSSRRDDVKDLALFWDAVKAVDCALCAPQVVWKYG